LKNSDNLFSVVSNSLPVVDVLFNWIIQFCYWSKPLSASNVYLKVKIWKMIVNINEEIIYITLVDDF
ncbi:MAG: hypothetical protein WBQ32_15905, partial [Ignavibacteriaceae bacterium]